MTLAVALALPAAGAAGGAKQSKPAEVIDATLLAQAQANQDSLLPIVVQGVAGVSAFQLANQMAKDHAIVHGVYTDLGSVSALIKGRDLPKLGSDPLVAGVTADSKLQTQAYQADEIWRQAVGVTSLYTQPATTCAPKQKGCVATAAVQAPQAPAIAIVDSGIDASKVADFGSRIEASVDFVSSEPGVTGDPLGHGTMVAGIAADSAPNHMGASPTSPLVDVRVADSQGQAQTSDVIAGLNWILQNKNQLGIRVVNISLGSSVSSTIAFDPLDQAVEQLWLNGLVVVVAAGNGGQGNQPGPVGSPADDPFVITVGAVDSHMSVKTNDDFHAPWSSWGTTADGFAKPEISAPGRYMIAPVPAGSLLTEQHPDRVGPQAQDVALASGYMWMSGTSFAAPVVSGAAAQVLAVHPDWTPDQVKGALMDTASHVQSAAGSLGTGVGEVNVAAAIADTSPGNPNAGLSAYVTTDGATGLAGFDPNAWHLAANATTSNWVRSNWVRSVGVSSNWVRSNWVRSNWVASNWVRSNWVATAWVSNNDAE